MNALPRIMLRLKNSVKRLMNKLATKEDIVYTPDEVAADILNHFNPFGTMLEPCRGGGAFHRLMPDGAEWCEITEGRDFYNWDKPIDWIITNPPYSIFDEFLDHAMTVGRDIVFLIPVNKLLSSTKKLRRVYAWGGIKEIRYYGSGREFGFPFGFPVGAVHLQREYSGPMDITWYKEIL